MVLVVRMRNRDGSRWLEGCRDPLWYLNFEVVLVRVRVKLDTFLFGLGLKKMLEKNDDQACLRESF